MQDFEGFLGDTPYEPQVFRPIAASGNVQQFQVWEKPRGLRAVHIVCLGPGGGGGGGQSSAANSSTGGGGGGGGGLMSALVPAFLCPEKLYLAINRGGLGGAAGANAGATGATRVLAQPYDGANFIMLLGAANGGAGQAGSPGGGGNGAGNNAQTPSPFMLKSLILWVPTTNLDSGVSGALGGAAAAGGNVGMASTSGLGGGAGGGGVNGSGVDQVGGSITTFDAAYLPTIAGGVAGGGGGSAGICSWADPFFYSYGGSGGGSFKTGGGGAGGNGGPGAGGGGGGAGTTGGRGGDGGDGLVVITCW